MNHTFHSQISIETENPSHKQFVYAISSVTFQFRFVNGQERTRVWCGAKFRDVMCQICIENSEMRKNEYIYYNIQIDISKGLVRFWRAIIKMMRRAMWIRPNTALN